MVLIGMMASVHDTKQTQINTDEKEEQVRGRPYEACSSVAANGVQSDVSTLPLRLAE
jgi:hypothetical protein